MVDPCGPVDTHAHRQYVVHNMPDRWLRRSPGWVIKTKPVVKLEGSSGTWSEKQPSLSDSHVHTHFSQALELQ